MSATNVDHSSRTAEVVLVHGACHGPWCWEDVVGPLRDAGLKVTAVELPLVSLDGDAEVVRDAVNRARGRSSRVVVVGHSYGGVVISAGAHGADHLVYCTATMPDAGQSATDVVPLLLTPELTASLAPIGDGSTFTLDPVAAIPAFFNRCSPDQVAAILPRLRPMHQACMTAAVGSPAWREVPSSYVVCSDDFAMATTYQRACAANLVDHVVIDADHSVFYSATEAFVERLISVARRVRDEAGPTIAT